ncbi:MAG: hypothetical protein RMI89_01140 [Gloeomargarita sp. SKYBB_i_bin120]|nr:hypothetical protein [Gloeomargarita sp. SKYB120]MDW8177126.1 hypothetical protein [Gloeomargarita sp. SKYBB_i_bin120]
MWQKLQRPTCELRWGWGRFLLKFANGLEIQGRQEQLTALTLLVLAYLATPSPPTLPPESSGEMVPVDESLPAPPRYHLQLTGLAPALHLTLQELYDLAWVLEAARTPRFPWWQQLAGWLALGTGLAVAIVLARIPRPVEVQVVTPLPPKREKSAPKAPASLPPPPPALTLEKVTALPPPAPPPPVPKPQTQANPKLAPQTSPPPELHGIQRYFQQRWQPPDTLQQPLTYRLVVTPTGALSRIVPLSPEAGLFLDQTPMPLVGETFMGAIPKTAQLQVVLEPSGQVRVWFEQWVD